MAVPQTVPPHRLTLDDVEELQENTLDLRRSYELLDEYAVG